MNWISFVMGFLAALALFLFMAAAYQAGKADAKKK